MAPSSSRKLFDNVLHNIVKRRFQGSFVTLRNRNHKSYLVVNVKATEHPLLLHQFSNVVFSFRYQRFVNFYSVTSSTDFGVLY